MKTLLRYFFFLTLSLQTFSAFAIDLQPGELIAPPPSINVLQVAYQFSERNDRYLNNKKVTDQTKVNSVQYLARLTHTFNTANLPSAVWVQVPIGYSHLGVTLSPFYQDTSGVGDVTLVYAVWPYANHDSKSYWAIGGYLNLPTGSYKAANGDINVGKNRTAGALQTGFQTSISESLNWMTALDVVYYGSNHDFQINQRIRDKYTLDQEPLYSFQTGLQYKINSKYSVSAAYFYTEGGETSLDSQNRDDETKLQRYQLSATGNFSFDRLMLQYGSDLTTKNGFIEDHRLIMRYITNF